ncbi:MAG TPA: hypothetical protein VNP03_11720 [Pseudonocardia sp.]|nr:hypothetical protein [Pseudonocardia sp.]
MSERWRHRSLAPVYALAITFLLVLLAGVALADPPPAEPPPANPSPRSLVLVQFSLHGLPTAQPKLPTGAPEGRNNDTQSVAPEQLWVRVELPGSRRQIDRPLDRADGLMLLVDEGARVCVTPPKGWSADGVSRDQASGEYCRQLGTPSGDVSFVLRKGS